jgi:hypothetical protein
MQDRSQQAEACSGGTGSDRGCADFPDGTGTGGRSGRAIAFGAAHGVSDPGAIRTSTRRGTLIERMRETQGQIAKDAALNSNDHANAAMEQEGAPAFARLLASLDTLLAQVSQGPATGRAGLTPEILPPPRPAPAIAGTAIAPRRRPPAAPARRAAAPAGEAGFAITLAEGGPDDQDRAFERY